MKNNEIVKILKKDGVIIFPTDTVWGMGCSIESVKAIKKFYALKNREPNKPTAVLVGSLEQAQAYGVINDQALSLMKAHWPGALTVVVKATMLAPKEILGKEKTVGLRFPDFRLVKEITQELGCGLVTGSANFAGNNPPLQKSELDPDLMKLVDLVVDGECGNQPPSTVVDATGKELKVLRQGAIKV